MLNGRYPASALAPIAGGRLAKAYALRWNMANTAVRASGNATVMPNGSMSAYRTFVQQVYLRSQWCAQGKCQNAAVPGNSNHGLGRAVDTNRRAVMWAHGTRFGVRPPTDAPWEGWHCLVHLDAVRVAPSGPPTLRKGVVNRKAVRRLQGLLHKHGMLRVPLNSRYDRRTRACVKQFQRKHGLRADAVVGPATWRALTH